jgi:tripartite-type tricarboxylate transporter receptor subunit TctC
MEIHMKQLPAVVVCVLVGGLSVASAQVYPARPITMVVPASAGGPTDSIARTLTERMAVSLGKNVIIENVGGASGTIGTGRVERAAPDGYTIGIGGWNHYVVNGAIYSLPYDFLKDFEPISQIATGPMLIISRKTVPANDLKEFIAWLKAQPDNLSFGTGGLGSPPHISGLSFEKTTGAHFQFVPYRGTAPAMQDLVAGHIDLMFDQASAALAPILAGTIKAYAVTAKTRLASAPGIPTVDEAGLPGFYVSVWHGMWAPKGTPKDIIAKLNAAVGDALADPLVRKRLAEIGQELPPKEQQTPAALAAFQKAEIERWWPIIRAANLKPE